VDGKGRTLSGSIASLGKGGRHTAFLKGLQKKKSLLAELTRKETSKTESGVRGDADFSGGGEKGGRSSRRNQTRMMKREKGETSKLTGSRLVIPHKKEKRGRHSGGETAREGLEPGDIVCKKEKQRR